MGRRTEYCLSEAVAMVNWLADEWAVHTGTHPYRRDEPFCQRCREELFSEAFSDDPDWCTVGWQIKRAIAKWKKRCRYAAKREGVKMTI